MARNRLVWLVTLTIVSVLPAGATLQTYTTLAGWQAAATQAGATIDFTSLGVPVGGASSPAVQSLIMDNVTFTSPTAGWMQVHNASSVWSNWGTGSILWSNEDLGALRATWTTPVTAFAALMGINRGGPTTWSPSQMDVKVRNGGTEVWGQALVTSAHPTLTFFGIVSTDGSEPFNSVTFKPAETGVSSAFLDDIRLGAYQDSAPVPEMGTGVLSLCGGILLAVGGFRMRGRPL
jgi:hypothetical protein